MLTFVEIAHTDKTQNAVIMNMNKLWGELNYAVYDGNFVTVHKNNQNQWIEGFVSTAIIGSPIDKITQNIPETINIDVWASGGEMNGYLDNNLSYFLDLEDAITHLQWQWDYLEYEVVDTDIDLFALDTATIRQHCLEHGGSYMGYTVDNYSYSIYKTTIRLIDYLLQEYS